MKSLLIWTILLSPTASTLAAAAPCQASLPAGTIIRMFPDERLVAGRAFGPVVFTVTPDVRLFPNRPAVIPRGSKVLGNVMESKQAGRLVGRAQTQIVLTSILTADSCEYPVDAKILEAGRYTATRDGVVVGRGHARRDLFEVLFPPTTIYQLIRIPSRGPSLVLDAETPITIKLMEPLAAQSAVSQAEVAPSFPSAPAPARLDCATSGAQTTPWPGIRQIFYPIRNRTPYKARLYMNGRPVSVLPPCYGPTMLIAFTSNFRLAATAVLATRQGQREVKLQIVPNENEDGWDIVDEAGIAAGVDLR
ncbi:MAG: hypothetical protein DMG17_23700 [Acidobacteria bacterium]|nr:MAG: hypothetical protein DMG17_23700 [Acidobacteriota bacterium]